MSEITLNVNGKSHVVDAQGDTPLLWILRDRLSLTGTKYSCGIGLCGSCTVLVDNKPVRSCIARIDQVAAGAITTIEGLADAGPNRVQTAWENERVSQCGYCQPGQIMSAVALLLQSPHPTDAEIDDAMRGNLCRCGTYVRIRRAIHSAARES